MVVKVDEFIALDNETLSQIAPFVSYPSIDIFRPQVSEAVSVEAGN